MDDRQRARFIGWLIALMGLTVAWSLVVKLRPVRGPRTPTAAPAVAHAPAPARTRSQAGARIAVVESVGPGYLDLLARAEIRRRIRASYPYTYLSSIVAASSDSMLHRWDDRVNRPVRVSLRPDTVSGFQAPFLDAVRAAFGRWEQARVPVRFDLSTDSTDAEVHFVWRSEFGIDRTGQTDLEWDQDGHLRSGTVTIATHDPRGHLLGPDDVRVVALHEIGHLIGLDHSQDSTDVMFAKTVLRDLSDRDIRTAKLLYALAPGSLR
jgi:hypothetical protein